jgi:hypothetical protein
MVSTTPDGSGRTAIDAAMATVDAPQVGTSDAPQGTADARAPDAPPPDAPAPDAPPPDAPPPVTLEVQKTGSGSVHSTPGGLDCGSSCSQASAAFPAGTVVALEARPEAGSYFAGWEGACAGITRTCAVTLDAAMTAQAHFTAISHNMVFITAATYDGNLGGLDGADAKCAAEASAVGLSGAYVALLSTETVDARSRLVLPGTQTPARGFVRMDGKPIADTVDDLFTKYTVLYPILFDSEGRILPTSSRVLDEDQYVFSGSFENGTRRPELTCKSFTSDGAGDPVECGQPGSGPGAWLRSIGGNCGPKGVYGRDSHIYCFGVSSQTPLPILDPLPGKRIYLTKSSLHMAGRAAANALCDAEKPAGTGTVKALISTTDQPAAAVLSMTTRYRRVDNVIVGTGAQLIGVSRGQGLLESGIWQNGDGSYPLTDSSSGYRWLGVPGIQAGLDVAGTPQSTCLDWTATDGLKTGAFAEASFVSYFGMSGSPNYPCYDNYLSVYCVEQ